MNEKTKIWFQDNWFKLAIIICILITVIGFIQYNNQKNSQELLKIRDEQLKRQENSDALKRCLLTAELMHGSNWDSECKINSMNGKKESCTLPTWDAKIVEDKLIKDKDDCFKQYSQS